VAEPQDKQGLPAWATVALAVAGIFGGILGTVAGTKLSNDHADKVLTEQTKAADKTELRGVVDQASIILRTQTAFADLNRARGAGRRHAMRPNEQPAIDALQIRVRALDVPQARLRNRLGNKALLTKAYTLVRLAFTDAAICQDFLAPAPDFFNGHPLNPDPYSGQAVGYFTDTAGALVGSALSQPSSAKPPSDKDLEALTKTITNAYSNGKCPGG
jgi:hypothetical protein